MLQISQKLQLTLGRALEESPWFKCDRVDGANPNRAVDVHLAVLLGHHDDDDSGGDADYDDQSDDGSDDDHIQSDDVGDW